MPETDREARRHACSQRHEHGGHVVEFSIVVLVVLAFVFGTFELARSLYVINTLQEVTRSAAQAAATANIGDAAVMAGIRTRAVFRQNAGMLPLGDPVSDDYVRIDFLALVADAAGRTSMTPVTTVSACPQTNRLNCLKDPNGASCIRFVRARICVPGAADTCVPATYRPVLPLVAFPIRLPVSTTIAPIESLGYQPGAGFCSS